MKKTDERVTTTTVTTATDAPSSAGVAAVLTVEEERVLRMRSGATVPETETLGSKLDGVQADVVDEVAARLRLIEAELLSRQPTADTERTRRIVEMLKRKAD
ncbi:MAG: hypothetical protein KC613_14440 [Myxococcales bacterium]|nr:hypothetical protein [Myxococcales bacterium]MCB9523139.1 hypothetical protein [Myxococcales bacterium]